MEQNRKVSPSGLLVNCILEDNHNVIWIATENAGLLRYIISYREHTGFHEQCVERIFMDVMRECRPERLAVYARYTRRGGLDINPFRTNFNLPLPDNARLARQ